MLPTKHPALLASHWRYWLSQGLSMEELSQVAGIPLPPTDRVSGTVVHRLYSYADERLGDPYLGLRMGHQVLLSDITPIMEVLLYSADGWQMLRSIQRFWPLLSEIEQLKGLIDSNCYRIRMVPARPELAHPQQTDTVVSGFLRLAAVLLGIDSTPDIAIRLRRSCPGDPEVFAELAGAPVSFEQPHDEISFSRSVLDTQNPARDAVRMQQALREAQRALSALRSRSFVEDVSALIREQLAQKAVDQDSIAIAMNISVRGLQRRLQQYDRTFRQLVDEVRQQLARELVAGTNDDFSEIASQLGYAEPGSLFKAFKRWTGLTCSQYRQRYGSNDQDQQLCAP